METPQSQEKKTDTHSYIGWLNSDSFVKRSLASLGYNIAGTLIVYGGIFLAAAVLWLLVTIGEALF
jgi:3-mercaptopyruvate sulfurtransferase SseA